MKTIARALFLSLSLLVTVAATGCVEAIDTNPAASEDVALASSDEVAPELSDDEGGGDQGQAPAPPIPAPPPLCNNGNAPGGQMIMPGWTCEIRVGSNLCCDTNRNLICARTGKIPFGTECVVNPNPNPWPNPNPSPTPIPTPTPTPSPIPDPSPSPDTEAPSTDVRVEPTHTPA